ncbi:hypothetical protein [Microcoleus sp. herbarium5]|uniref:hypothetical protein n=1 Tax=Microcoleus sp. herbarium5 TaxID=3055434 RepID=UPI002FD6553D
MFVAPQYLTDLGFTLGYLKMDVAFVGEDLRSLKQIRDLSELSGVIPALLEPQLLKFNHPCRLVGIIPRFSILTVRLQGENQRIKLAYPFRANTSEWQMYWNDILSNPLIMSAQSIGESISDPFLKRVN